MTATGNAMVQPHDQVEIGWWRRFTAALPMRTALAGVGAVWALGCVWSFHEQWNFAAAKGFAVPWLLPLVIDGLAAAMAGVAYAASLDGRPALSARLATAVAVAASAGSNAAWAYERAAADIAAVTLAMGIPVAANVAFEVLLSEMRRQVQRRRGMPAPVAVPYPRLLRLVLAPISTFAAWRRLVLELTDPRAADDVTAAVTTEAQLGSVSQPEPVPGLSAGSRPEPASDLPAGPRPEPVSELSARWQPESALEPPAGLQLESASEMVARRLSESASDVLAGPSHEQHAPVEPVRSDLPRPVSIAGNGQRLAITPRPAAEPARQQAPVSAEATADARVLRVAELIIRGEELTGESVGGLLGCSARTGRRLLRQGMELAQAQRPLPAAARRPVDDGVRNSALVSGR